MTLFKMGEFINMAVKDEQTGEAFYRAAAEVVMGRDLKSNLVKIADQEKRHAERFGKMLAEIGMKTPREEYAGQYDGFLNVLLETRAFPDPSKAIQRALVLKSDMEAIELAMRLEKNTLLFYFEMKEFIPDTHTKHVRDIIDEEKKHLTTLNKLIKKAR